MWTWHRWFGTAGGEPPEQQKVCILQLQMGKTFSTFTSWITRQYKTAMVCALEVYLPAWTAWWAIAPCLHQTGEYRCATHKVSHKENFPTIFWSWQQNSVTCILVGNVSSFFYISLLTQPCVEKRPCFQEWSLLLLFWFSAEICCLSSSEAKVHFVSHKKAK